MPDVPTRSAIRITGLVPNVVSYNAQGQPSYRKINAAPQNPTTVQPETAKLVSISTDPVESAIDIDSAVNAAVKARSQNESDYRQGLSNFNQLSKMIDAANASSNPMDFSKAYEYAESNEASLSKVMEPGAVPSLMEKLKDTASNLRFTNLTLSRIDDALNAGQVSQARVIAEQNQNTLSISLGADATSKYLNQLKQAETEQKTSGFTLDKISKAIDAQDYTTARQIAESNRAILEKTVGTTETANYIKEIRTAEIESIAQAKPPFLSRNAVTPPETSEFVKRGIAPTPESELPISGIVRSVTEPAAKFLNEIVPTQEKFMENTKDMPEAIRAFGLFGEGAYRTIVPGTVEFVGQGATAIEAAVKHPEKIIPATLAGGAMLAQSTIQQAKENPFGLAGSFTGMFLAGKAISKIPTAKIAGKVGEVIEPVTTAVESTKVVKGIKSFIAKEQKLTIAEEFGIKEISKPVSATKPILSKEFESPGFLKDTSDKAIKAAAESKRQAESATRAGTLKAAEAAKPIEELGLAKDYIRENLQKYLEKFKEKTFSDLEKSGKNVDLPSMRRQVEAAVQIEKIRITKPQMPVIKARNIIEKLLGTKARRSLSKEFESPGFLQIKRLRLQNKQRNLNIKHSKEKSEKPMN